MENKWIKNECADGTHIHMQKKVKQKNSAWAIHWNFSRCYMCDISQGPQLFLYLLRQTKKSQKRYICAFHKRLIGRKYYHGGEQHHKLSKASVGRGASVQFGRCCTRLNFQIRDSFAGYSICEVYKDDPLIWLPSLWWTWLWTVLHHYLPTCLLMLFSRYSKIVIFCGHARFYHVSEQVIFSH